MNNPPKPKKIIKKLKAHGDIRTDEYYWLRDDFRKDKEIISYLKQENDYSSQWFEERTNYKDEIYNEMLKKLPDKETSMKIRKGDYLYFSEISLNEQYSRYYREKNKDIKLLLDLNVLAKDQEYFSISGISPSPDHSLIAYGEDLSGRREFNIKVKNIEKDEIVDEGVFNCSGNVVWSFTNEYFFYTKKDPKTLINNKVFKRFNPF